MAHALSRSLALVPRIDGRYRPRYRDITVSTRRRQREEGGGGPLDEELSTLLLKAVRALPEAEQDRVLTALFHEAIRGPSTFTHPVPGPGTLDVLFQSEPPLAGGAPTAMFPVRLPPDLHERLRAWAAEHGFSMASVVRGLVERFLAEQAKASAGAPGARRRAARPASTSRSSGKPRHARPKKRSTSRG